MAFWSSDEDYYKDAQKLLNKKNYFKALEKIDKAIKKNNNKAKFWALKGEIENHRPINKTTVLEYYNKAIELDKDNNPSYFVARAQILYKLKDYNAAKKDLKKVIDLDNADLDALILLGKINEEQKEYSEAISTYNSALKKKGFIQNTKEEISNKINDLKKIIAEEYFDKGKRYYDSKDYEKAIEWFEKAKDVEPNDDYLYWCAKTKYSNGQNKEALKDINAGIKLKPDDVCYCYKLKGDINKALGKYDVAKKSYLKAINEAIEGFDIENVREKIEELDKIQTEEYFQNGKTYYDEENFEGAIKCFEKAKDLSPDNDNYLYWCADAKYRNNQNKEALIDIDISIKLNPDDVCYCYELRGDINKNLEKYDTARKNYLKAINEAIESFDIENVQEKIKELDKIQAEEYFQNGKTYYNENNYEEAIKRFEKAKDLTPDNDTYLYWCGYVKYWNDKEEEAIKDFDRAIELNPIPKYYYFRGHSKYFMENYKEAIEDYNIGISKKPEDVYNYYELLADAKKELEDIPGAIEDYKRALENNPDINKCQKIKETMEMLTEVQTDTQSITDNQESEELEQQEPEDNNFQKYNKYISVGYKLIDKGKSNRAKNIFFDAIKLYPKKPDGFFGYAIALNNLGQNKELEKDNLQKALKFPPDSVIYKQPVYDFLKKIGRLEDAEKYREQTYRKVEQEYIFEANRNKCFLVNAGPGTGKTYTLIQKIKHLVESGIPEKNILVLSHTNAAVDEIKNRLKNISENTDIMLHRINIRTICSFVKFAHSKIDEHEEKAGKDCYSYSATEKGFTKANDELIERLASSTYNFCSLLKDFGIQYFIVDEIQDAVDSVGTIILKLVKACVKSQIPFALFGDECQAIFDFDKTNDEKYKLKSAEFYEKIKELLKNQDNVELVSLDKNMRQKKELRCYSEDLNNYRKAILSDDKDKDKYLKNIQEIAPVNIYVNNIDIPENATHCIITHSNNRALYIASTLQKRGIRVHAKITENKIQFEYHDWIAKVANHRWGDGDDALYITCEKFEDFINQRGIELPNLPANYEGKDKENPTKSFFKYLNTEIMDEEAEQEINKDELLKKLYYEYKCDSIFKNENKCSVEVSTIHKAKGREFDFVHIDSECCASDYFEDKDKCMYVALTRPKYFLDFVGFKMSDFNQSQRLVNRYNYGKKRENEKIKLLFIIENKKLKQYKVLYNDIDLTSFKDYQKKLSDLKVNTKITLCIENNSWIITHNNQKIGEMATSFVNNLEKVNTKYSKPKKITGLRVDGIWSVFEKEDDGGIKTWNVLSFCGFGDVEY